MDLAESSLIVQESSSPGSILLDSNVTVVNEKPIQRRNTWNEKKNGLLVQVVKTSKYSTPWRPKHGTNKEIWQDIAERITLEHGDVFETPIHWEAAKEQLLKIIDRQRLRRSLGDFSIKSQMEIHLDDMIKHMQADDEEKANSLRRQQERAQKRQSFRKPQDPLDPRSEDINSVESGDQSAEKRAKLDESLLLGNGVGSSSDGQGLYGIRPLPPIIYPNPYASGAHVNLMAGMEHQLQNHVMTEEELALEKEKLRLEAELQKEKMRLDHERERDEAQARRDEHFIQMIQDQLQASQTMLQAAQAMMSQMIQKIDSWEQRASNPE